MGNLNCCTNQQAPLDIGTTEQPMEQTVDITNTNKPQEVHAANIEEVQEQVQEQQKVESKVEEQTKQQSPEKPVENYAETKLAQRTEYPDASFTVNVKERVATFSPLVVSSLKELDQILPYITINSEPSEQVISLKKLLFGLKNSLSALLLNWIGVYEVKKETTNFVQSLNDKLTQIRVFLSDLEKKAQETQKTDNQTTESLLRELLRDEQNTKQIQSEFVNHLQEAHNQFSIYTSPRNCLNNGQNTLNLENVNLDLEYNFPAYIRAHFRGQVGYPIWGKLFGANIDVCKKEFVQAYSKENQIDAGLIDFIMNQIMSPYDTISLFEFLHFIRENREYFEATGLIVKDKLKVIEAHIEKLVQQKEEEIPKEASEGVFEYENGAKYEGKLENNKRNGKGKLTFQQYSYEGEFKDGQPNGQGLEDKFGVKYQGQFVNGLFQGEGELTFPDGTVYKGVFANNKFEGQGSLTAWNTVVFSGQFKGGFLADGTITYPTGETYEGQISQNRYRHGKGVQKSVNGSVVFEGQFLNDEPSNGKLFQGKELLFEGELDQNKITSGKYYYSDAEYNGNINTGLHIREQEGILEYKTTASIKGNWLNDAPNKATKIFDSKSPEQKYEGDWNNFTRSGKGKFYYQSGAIYEGDIENSLRIGQGTYIFKNQNKYQGQWADNDLNGEGVFTFSNGDVYTGQFVKGKFHGKGTYKYANGTQYEGEWANDKWNGQGKYTNPSGEVIKEGKFVDDDILKAA